jgi:hypothetical protein
MISERHRGLGQVQVAERLQDDEAELVGGVLSVGCRAADVGRIQGAGTGYAGELRRPVERRADLLDLQEEALDQLDRVLPL